MDIHSVSQYRTLHSGLVMNPEHVTVLAILIGTPLNEFLIKKYLVRYISTLLNEVKIGLYIRLIREMIYSFISILVYSTENDPSCFKNILDIYTSDNSAYSIKTSCLVYRTSESL